jgi:hypothetical protein
VFNLLFAQTDTLELFFIHVTSKYFLLLYCQWHRDRKRNGKRIKNKAKISEANAKIEKRRRRKRWKSDIYRRYTNIHLRRQENTSLSSPCTKFSSISFDKRPRATRVKRSEGKKHIAFTSFLIVIVYHCRECECIIHECAKMLRIIIILAFSLSCNNELLFRLNIAYGKFHGVLTTKIRHFNNDFPLKFISLLSFLIIARSFSTSASQQQQQSEALVADKPYFVENPRNITALHNDSVTLKCTVRNKANRTVRHFTLTCRKGHWHDSLINHAYKQIPSGFLDTKARSRHSNVQHVCLHIWCTLLRHSHSRLT